MAKRESPDTVLVCPTCDKIYTKLENVHTNEYPSPDPEDMDTQQSDNGRKSKKRRIEANSKGIDLLGHEPLTESTWVPKSDYTPNFPLTPSAKTAALKAILLKGFDEAPLDKVSVSISFSFRVTLRADQGRWLFMSNSALSPASSLAFARARIGSFFTSLEIRLKIIAQRQLPNSAMTLMQKS